MINIAKVIIDDETIKEVVEVLKSGHLVEGKVTRKFEESFAKWVNCKFAYSTSSGSTALLLALLSLIKKDDEVIVPSFTHISTANSVIYARGRVKFVDIDQETYNLSVEDLKLKISRNTKAIIAVHLFGLPANLKEIGKIAEDYNAIVISDAAQAHGAKIDGVNIANLSHLSCYSFYPTKNIVAGEGGMVACDCEDCYRKGLLIKNHGDKGRYEHVDLGFNFRLNDIASAIGFNYLKKADELISRRIQNAKFLISKLEKLETLILPKVPKGYTHVYNQFSLRINKELLKVDRDGFVQELRKRGIDARVHYPLPIPLQPIYKSLHSLDESSIKVSKEVSSTILSLPVHPYLTQEELSIIANKVEEVSKEFQKF
ncbi:MAG: DegT/DnrJ/EryC1/StrS aminotransferase family protein [Nitrososphaerales archaeon]